MKIIAIAPTVALFLIAACVPTAWAVDGVVLIDQNKAAAGGVTPGDAPGFPVTISQPGSYRLSGNLAVPDGNTTAIDITSSFVSLDLNGFSIIGPASCAYSSSVGVTCSGTGVGIGVKAGAVSNGIVTGPQGVSVRNGTVRGMGSFGVLLYSGTVENVQASSNGSSGIVAFTGGRVMRSIVATNRRDGILANQGVVVQNVATSNGGNGISGNGIIVTENVMQGNWAFGLALLGDSGYLNNVLSVNNWDPATMTYGAQVSNGQGLGKNVCDPGPSPCP